MPGVVEIFTGKDIADAKVGGLICGWVVKDKHGQPHKAPPHPVMALDTVRYVGDTVAMVVANSHDEAQGRRRGDQGRLRGAAGQRRSRQGARQGRARGPSRSAGQPDLRLGNRREGRCRCGLRQGGARHQARHRQQPPDPQRHGAARRGGRLRQGHGQLHALVDVAEPACRCASSCRPSCSAFPSTSCASIAPDVGGGFGSKIFCYDEETMVTWAASPRRPADQVDGRAQRIVP